MTSLIEFLRRWWLRAWDGRVLAYEITGTQFERFRIGDRIIIGHARRRVIGHDHFRDVLYVW